MQSRHHSFVLPDLVNCIFVRSFHIAISDCRSGTLKVRWFYLSIPWQNSTWLKLYFSTFLPWTSNIFRREKVKLSYSFLETDEVCSCFQCFLLLDFDQSDWSQPLKTQFDLRTAIDQFAVFCCRSLEFDALTCLLIRSSCLCCIQFWLVNHHRLGTHSSAEDARFWHHVILNLHILEFYCPIFKILTCHLCHVLGLDTRCKNDFKQRQGNF